MHPLAELIREEIGERVPFVGEADSEDAVEEMPDELAEGYEAFDEDTEA